MTLGPACAMSSRSDSSKPRTSAVIPTMDVMPMTTPRTVRADRSLFASSVSNAIATTSPTRPSRIAMAPRLSPRRQNAGFCVVPLFVPQRFDRIQPRRLERGIHAEEDADGRREADADRERPPRQGNREAGEQVHGPADAGAEAD